MNAAADAMAALATRLGPSLRLNEPLWRHTSYRIGGPADAFIIARRAEELCTAVSVAAELSVPWRVIGSASNLLVADEGVPGLVIKPMTRSSHLERDPENDLAIVHAEAGCLLAAAAKKSALAGFTGLEWAISVPGTVGASVVNNSGAFGSSVVECLQHATLFFPGRGLRTVPAADMGYAYRTSHLKRGEWSGAVVDAAFRVQPSDAAVLRARLDELEERRRQTQPFGPSVGSVFRNPEPAYAGALIEQAGLKGTRSGDAEISPVHANFILNVGHASARDVLTLVRSAQQTVWARERIWLVPEIEFVGRWKADELLRLTAPATDA